MTLFNAIPAARGLPVALRLTQMQPHPGAPHG